MAKILHIQSNPNPGKSFSKELTNAFLEAYQQKNPDDQIQTLDLEHQSIPFWTKDNFMAMDKFKAGEALSQDEQEKVDRHNALIDDLMSADKIIITVPMWNFGVPASLKAYIDQVVIAGKTFKYTEQGEPVGLIEGKKMAILEAHGGDYSQMQDMDMCGRYLQTIFGWLGIKDQTRIVVEGSMMPDSDARLAEQIKIAQQKAQEF